MFSVGYAEDGVGCVRVVTAARLTCHMQRYGVR